MRVTSPSMIRLGAGRSQVQILSPRYKKKPGNKHFCAVVNSPKEGPWGTIGAQFILELARKWHFGGIVESLKRPHANARSTLGRLQDGGIVVWD
jgi:hypothetical protein